MDVIPFPMLDTEEKYQALEKYCIDLTESTQQGKLNLVIGGDDEVRRSFRSFAGELKTIL